MSDQDNVKKPNWFKRHKILTGILIVVAVFILIGAAGGSSENSTPQASPQSAAADQATPATTGTPKQTPAAATYEPIDAKAMITEFDENQLSAEKKYEKKLVEFKAKINNISEDILGTAFLSLIPATASDTYFGTSIKCNFDNSDAITAVKKGQVVTVHGEVKTQTVGIITVDKCSLVQ